MSRLTTKPPVTVTIGGIDYPINTSFRNCLLSTSALEDVSLSELEKADILMGNHFSEPRPNDVNAAVEQIVKYLTQNRDLSKDDINHPHVLDFDQDGQMIYDAFLSKGINLDESSMTFWEFMAHLRELPKDCMLHRIIHLRLQQNRGKLSKEERLECSRIGWNVINIRDSAVEQMDAAISAYYEGLQQESGDVN